MGGPIATGWLMAHNFRVFKKNGLAVLSITLSVFFTIALGLGLYFLPEKYFVPRHFVPVCYTIIAHFCVAGFQSKKIDEYVHKGFLIFSGWRVAAITLICAGLAASLFFGIDYLNGKKNETKYGKVAFGALRHTLFYEDGTMNAKELAMFGRALMETGFFNEPDSAGPKLESRIVRISAYNMSMKYRQQPSVALRKSLRVKKTNGDYELFICSNVFADTGISEMNSYFENLRKMLQQYFPANKIIINLTDNEGNTVLYRIDE